MKLLQLIKDFRKWRRERYENALSEVVSDIAYEHYKTNSENAFCAGCVYGMKHRKEILKKAKIWQ